MTLLNKSATELQQLLSSKEVSVKELTEASLKQIATVDGDVQAFLTVTEESALATAEKLDATPDSERGALFGLPIGIKDNIVTKDVVTTCASRMLENFVPVYDATVVEKVAQAGMISVGKLNMDEFAMGSTTETSYFKKTRNPWNLDHVPGGSSGGSAAAVAAGEVSFTLGTDTGGSVRQPAAYCGIVGMKPTYGRISRAGVVAFGSSLDQVGPITRTVEDNALLLEALAGADYRDTSSSKEAVPSYREGLTGELKGLKIGLPKEYIGEGVAPEVKDAIQESVKVLESLGAIVEEVSLPHSTYAPSTYYVIGFAEASSNFSRFDGIRFGHRSENAKSLDEIYLRSREEGFGHEVKKRLLFGTYALSADYHEALYVKAQKVRTLITKDFTDVFANYDLIIGPTAATTAYKIDQQDKDERTTFADDLLTVPVNLAGVPAISVPCGFANELPIGLQFIGKHFDELTVYKAAHAYEQATDFHKRTPALGEGKVQ